MGGKATRGGPPEINRQRPARLHENMNTIKDIIPQVIEQLSLRQPDSQMKIHRIWQNIVDERMSTHSALVNFNQGILSVCVDSSSWLFQMNLNKRRILERLQEEMPEVKNIQFKIGKVT